MRTSILTALQRIKCFGEEVNESMRRFGSVIQQIEGNYQVMQTEDHNTTVTDQVLQVTFIIAPDGRYVLDVCVCVYVCVSGWGGC